MIDINEMIDTTNNPKKISIMGTNNRYQVKKLLGKDRKEKKQNKISQKWNIEKEVLTYEKQKEIMKTLTKKLHHDKEETNEIHSLFIQQLNHKIANYKQQDVVKKILDKNTFVSLQDVINHLVECNVTCFYCKCDLLVLYEIVREPKQWTLDRINNTIGHTKDNVVISCLECNLKRKNINKDSFFFTKNLHIVKNDNISIDTIK